LKPESLTTLLNDPRPAVRKRAIGALAMIGAAAVPAIGQVLASASSFEARLNAVWAATRIDVPEARSMVRGALRDSDETVRQAATHSVSLWRDREAVSLLLDLLTHGTPHNRRVAAEALGRIGDSQAVKPLLDALSNPNDRVLEHSLTYALIEIDDAKATAVGLQSSNPRVRRAALIALDQMENGGLEAGTVASELTSTDPAVREAAAWIAGLHRDWGDALVSVLRQRLAQPNLTEPDLTQLQHQLALLAQSPVIAQLLADRLEDAQSTPQQRQVALGAMGESALKQVPASWTSALATQLKEGDASLIQESVSCASKLLLSKEAAKEMDAKLLGVAERIDLPPATRLSALGALRGGVREMSPELFTLVASQLSAEHPATERITAAQIMGHATLHNDQLMAVADLLKTAGPLEINHLVSAFEHSSDGAVGMKLVSALKQAKALKSLRAEALRPRLKKFGPQVQKEAEPLWEQLSPDAAKQKARLDQLMASLPVGDVRRGQVLFNGAKAACSACHAIGYVGGHVGPDLTRIGQIRAERDLLESIAFPSASFVQSFEPVMIETTDGEHQYGIVRKNDVEELMLVTGPNQEVHIPKSKLKEMRPGTVSLMPDGFDQQLAPQELADLVAFLRACR
jgi:putative heme-binding domain-containing protein